MTARKPPNVSFPDWVERQIRTAQADGAFDNLPGAGKPIPGIDRAQHEMDWIAGYLRRENVDVAALLPPALALAKEMEVLPDRLLGLRSESQVRKVIENLNERVGRARLQPQVGPPIRVRTVDVDETVERWRASVAAMVHVVATEVTDAAEPRPARRRSWFGRRSV
jgi:Domain of unknown function (DUF1992)